MGWTGEQTDPTTGMTYLRARDYAPGSGQFLSHDTMIPNAAGTQGYNSFAYATNNPVTFTDPSGHSGLGGITFPGGAGWGWEFNIPWALIIPRLLALLAGLTFGEWAVVAIIIVIIVLFIASVHFEWDKFVAHFGERAGSAAKEGAGDALNRMFNGAGAAVELPGQVKDKIQDVIDRSLGKIAESVVIGAAIVVVAAKAIDAIRIPDEVNSCLTALAKSPPPWPISQERYRHIEEWHGPTATYLEDNPKTRFSAAAWGNLQVLVNKALFSPTEPPRVGSNKKCIFTNRATGGITGRNIRNNGDVQGIRVIYNYIPPRKGEIWNAFPIDTTTP